jgi:hypothetical protein
LEIGISTSRYLPAIGTAGFERLAVSGYKRVPAPPPKITDKISLDMMRDLLFYLFVVYSLLFVVLYVW